MKREKFLYIGPSPSDPTPGAALRARVNLSMRITPSGWVKWRCPYCGSRGKQRVRSGEVKDVWIYHEPWCPVPVDEEVAEWGEVP